VNNQNMRVWVSEHPHNMMETLLHPEEWTMCCALSTSGIVGPFSRRYCDFWSLSPCPPKRISSVSPRNVSISENDFNRTGLSRTQRVALNMLIEHFDYRVLCNRFPERFGYW
jgi:hypothetical protein